jgi:hypothetical protein
MKVIAGWSVTDGDFQRGDETDYVKNFKYARKQKKAFESRTLLVFSLSVFGILLWVLETIVKQ